LAITALALLLLGWYSLLLYFLNYRSMRKTAPLAFAGSLLAVAAFFLISSSSIAQSEPAVLIADVQPLAQPIAQPALPDAPSAVLAAATSADSGASSSEGLGDDSADSLDPQNPEPAYKPVPQHGVELDANGNPIPISKRQPQRILGFMPNFRSVSTGAVAHPPGWKYNFTVATHQAFDYSSFIFLGITSLSAEGINSHPVLGKGVDGFYAYTWRGFLDKTDGNYLGGWFLPSLLHEDTRYYAMGSGHSILYRSLYVMSRQVVTRTYSEHDTPNFAGLGGKVLAQVVSREYYPAGATSFGVLATKFAYASMRDISFTAIREFYPDVAGHYVRKHHEKMARLAAKDAKDAQAPSSPPQ
jgi:hypothetical protein